MNAQYKRLIIALAVLLGIAGIFILYLSWPLLTGTSVILKTQPVDPFDVFRGQYITIGYDISNIQNIEGAKENDQVYISLKEGPDKIWNADGISLKKPETGIFIRGTLRQSWRGLRPEFGIEQYFFERDGHVETRNMRVEAKIDASGQARIIKLLNENLQPLNISYKKQSLTS